MSTSLYLIPSLLGETEVSRVLPNYNTSIIQSIRLYFVEELRTARRFLRTAGFTASFDETELILINEHTKSEELYEFGKKLEKQTAGLISEAGLPAVADPGASLVKIAHQKNIKVVPLVGPSSIFLALMASGLDGQNFAFNGYLPIDKTLRIKAIQNLERKSKVDNQTQIFMETPYRNNSVVEDVLQNCKGDTLFCIATNITTDQEFIKTQTISDWKKNKKDIHKQPAIFLIQAF